MMKIDRTSVQNHAPVRRVDRTSKSGGSGFSKALDNAGGDGDTAGVAAGTSVGGLDALLALQEVPDSLARREKGRKHGERLLDMLDELRVNLLEGRLSEASIGRLAGEVERAREETDDPRLNGILDEIELRARVELAKLQR
jgi:hypothetical protein